MFCTTCLFSSGTQMIISTSDFLILFHRPLRLYSLLFFQSFSLFLRLDNFHWSIFKFFYHYQSSMKPICGIFNSYILCFHVGISNWFFFIVFISLLRFSSVFIPYDSFLYTIEHINITREMQIKITIRYHYTY